jgi:ATP-dependent DNA helicase DinG
MLRDAERALAPGKLTKLRDDKVTKLAAATRDVSGRFFAELAQLTRETDGRSSLARDVWRGPLLERYHALDTALEAMAAWAQSNETSEAVEIVARRAKQTRDDLAGIVDGSSKQVTWIEVRSRSAIIGSSPVDLAPMLRSKVFENIPAVVLTSATLATHAGFSFLRSRVGLDTDSVDVEELAVASPFDFASRALLYVPRDLPEPNDPNWLEPAVARMMDLIDATRGGAFVLCTSNRAMRLVHGALKHEIARHPRLARCKLLLQGDRPKGALLSDFREQGDAILVATMSFWEGVDVPGHALRLVVMDKIPFAVPTDPVVVARAAALEANGSNPFMRYHVPSAAITLKQGFGRLIRTRSDAGIVAILDRRLRTRGYGTSLLASLPPAKSTEDIDDVRAFARALGLDARSPSGESASSHVADQL